MADKKISKLTKDHEAQIPVYLDRYLKIGLSTEPCDLSKAEDAIKRCYKNQKLNEPTIIWADSPFAGSVIAAQLANGTETPTKEQIADQANYCSWGSFDAYWVSFYAFISEQLLQEAERELVQITKDIVQNCGVYWSFEDDPIVVMTHKPTVISMVDGKLHNLEGMALKYKDGTGLFAAHGKVYSTLLELELDLKLSNVS